MKSYGRQEHINKQAKLLVAISVSRSDEVLATKGTRAA